MIGDFCVKDDLEIRDYILSIREKLDMKVDSKEFLDNYLNNYYNESFMTKIIWVIDNKITLSEFIIYQSINNFYLSSFYSFISIINEYPKYKASLERIEDIFNIKEEVFDSSNYYTNYNLNF